jgi:serine/threonine protein kinase
MLGTPLFPGESAVDQLIEIIKVLGTPTREEIFAMNPNHSTFNFPAIKAHSWSKVFKNRASESAMDLIGKWLRYDPKTRLDAFESLGHPFFDELRESDAKMPGGVPLPPHLFQFTEAEIKTMKARNLTKKLIPRHLWVQYHVEEAENNEGQTQQTV